MNFLDTCRGETKNPRLARREAMFPRRAQRRDKSSPAGGLVRKRLRDLRADGGADKDLLPDWQPSSHVVTDARAHPAAHHHWRGRTLAGRRRHRRDGGNSFRRSVRVPLHWVRGLPAREQTARARANAAARAVAPGPSTAVHVEQTLARRCTKDNRADQPARKSTRSGRGVNCNGWH